ncbi:uncharacterized protein LOC133923271 [Phragmites australis]|uniref:uncharacterized protein LOC133923271 n=1 Tax=Phragmites australis TaxID=29695 RepID=UPI002D76A321|nr:uncharacterized protein LOC133923271 [Phragmites australis]
MIRQYNAIFAFTSLGVTVEKLINTGDGPYVFRINGVVHHRIGSLLPPAGQRPQFAQLYVYDTSNEVQNRLDIFERDGPDRDEPDPAIVQDLIHMLDQYNPLVKKFRMARDRIFSPESPDVHIRLLAAAGEHGNRDSFPSVPELATLIVADLTIEACDFDLVVHAQPGYLQKVSLLNPSLMSLQYPLLFPYSERSFHLGIKYRPTANSPTGGREDVTMREFYCYQVHYRQRETNPYTCCGRLSDQAIVNCYSCIEASRLQFFYFNQDLLRSDTYQGITDALGQGASGGKSIGVKWILPSSHVGSPRYLAMNYQDAMAVCRQYGAPDIFTTFTCNPKWPEIAEALRYEPGQQHTDRSDVITRVFHMKLDEYIADIRGGTAFGPIRAYMYTIEFQKRGLPHVHILVWLAAHSSDPFPSFIDTLISAELPNPQSDPLGYGLVQEFMVHGPCGSMNLRCSCMKQSVCSKRFPKSFNSETSIDEAGFPLYRRANNGLTIRKGRYDLDNRWVVPYNMAILKKYQAHINVEWCNKTNLVKYLFKYITKGHDKATFAFVSASADATPQLEDKDEIADHIRCRYLSACEAMWRLLGFEIHGRMPAVERLAVHMPGMNIVIFHESADLEDIVENPHRYKTTLTEWFTTNQTHPSAMPFTYCEFPTYYRWDPDRKSWIRRQRSPKVGRIYNVHPSTGELFHLRMLLMVVAGATSFASLRTYNGIIYDTFREACQARGLVGDDNEWYMLFDESIIWASPYQLRHLFLIVLVFCDVVNAKMLFAKYWRHLADDIAYRIRLCLGNPRYFIPDCHLQAQLLSELTVLFSKSGVNLSSYNLSSEETPGPYAYSNRLIAEELTYDRALLAEQSSTLASTLNHEQRSIYDTLIASVISKEPGTFFISGHGGTGKTYLWNAIIAKLRAEGEIVLAVASSGVASLLLPSGRTAHSRFRIPLDINERSICSISRGTMLADLISKASLVLWDEAPMTHRRCFEALDRTMRDILSADEPSLANVPFGGKLVVLGGDFRQVLPVIARGTRSDVVSASLVMSPIWQHITVLKLYTNMRLTNPALGASQRHNLAVFAQWVLDVGNGDVPMATKPGEAHPTWLQIPHDLLFMPSDNNIQTIIDSTYDSFDTMYSDTSYLTARAIVCPTNSTVDEINDVVFNQVPGEAREYLSYDTISKTADHVADVDILYPPEFLNSITVNNFPHHCLCLKVGVPIILLRNINQSIGLCNGTRLIVTRLGDHVLEARILTGTNIGQTVCIPRIVLNSASPKWPFTLQRRQYPIRLSYAMTINKSQGQTLSKVGIYL